MCDPPHRTKRTINQNVTTGRHCQPPSIKLLETHPHRSLTAKIRNNSSGNTQNATRPPWEAPANMAPNYMATLQRYVDEVRWQLAIDKTVL
jgi:hypothetical protein